LKKILDPQTTGLYLDGSTFKIMLRLLCSLRPCACGDHSLFVQRIGAISRDENAGYTSIYAIRADIPFIIKIKRAFEEIRLGNMPDSDKRTRNGKPLTI
jgi:hypothetical protein